MQLFFPVDLQTTLYICGVQQGLSSTGAQEASPKRCVLLKTTHLPAVSCHQLSLFTFFSFSFSTVYSMSKFTNKQVDDTAQGVTKNNKKK